jgi:hypothetical protein
MRGYNAGYSQSLYPQTDQGAHGRLRASGRVGSPSTVRATGMTRPGAGELTQPALTLWLLWMWRMVEANFTQPGTRGRHYPYQTHRAGV